MIISFELKPLTIEFTEARYGWLYFTLRYGEQLFYAKFSHVFDPIIRLKRCLEAVAIGVEQCSFTYDPEGDVIRWGFQQIAHDRTVFTVSDASDGARVLHANVDRKQLIGSLYLGFLEFSQSDRFDRREWEVETIGERFVSAAGMDTEAIVEWLCTLDRSNLRKTLFKIDPQVMVSYSNVDDLDQVRTFIETEVQGKPLPSGVETISTEQYWPLSRNYNCWSPAAKRRFVEECLREQASGYGGTKLLELKSPVIDALLFPSIIGNETGV